MGKAITYLDDILLNADSIGEMIDGILPIFFELLRESGMKLAPKKTEFFKEEVAFLEFYISSKGIRPINKKVDALKKMKSPETKKDILRFIGACAFYARFVNFFFYRECKPFFNLVRDGVKFQWTEKHEKLFRWILDGFSSDIIRAIPRYKLSISKYIATRVT